MKIKEACLYLKADNFEDAIREMVESLDLSQAVKEKVASEVIDREHKASTFVGNQVALPHCKTKEAKGIITIFGRKDVPIMFGENRDKEVKLIFLIISCADEIREHLRTLASIAKPLKDGNNLIDLLGATSKEDVEKIMNRS